MLRKLFVVLAAGVLLFMGACPGQVRAAGKLNEIEKAGKYRGTIVRLQAARCSQDPGDKRYCKRVYLAISSRVPVTSRLHLYTEITGNGKVLYAGPDEDKSVADQINYLDRLVNKLLRPKKGATISVSCDDDNGCVIDRIDLR